MFRYYSPRKSLEMRRSADEPQFSEGRGHRFESCRVRQFLRLIGSRPSGRGVRGVCLSLLALFSIAMIGYLYGCKTDDR